jgi:hypothetical protein
VDESDDPVQQRGKAQDQQEQGKTDEQGEAATARAVDVIADVPQRAT